MYEVCYTIRFYVLCILLYLSLFMYIGHGIPPLLKAIMHLFPLDTYVDAPVGRVCM